MRVNILTAIATFTLLLSACNQGQAAADFAKADEPIPECGELLSDARKSYVENAKADCKRLTTLDARLKSKDCLIMKEHGSCEARNMFKRGYNKPQTN